MKKVIFTLIAVFSVAIAQNLTAQEVETIKLKQTKGEFDKKELTLTAGTTYQFEVMNNGVDHEVGFVLAPANNPDGHIKEAYLGNTVMDGKSAKSGEVTLAAGEYVFFCPMNPTPQYKVTVKEGMDKKAMMAKEEMAKKEKMAKEKMAKEKMAKEEMAKKEMAKKEMAAKDMTMEKSSKKVKTIKLTQTPGKFNKKALKLKEGRTYKFQVANDGVDHEVGFVLAPASDKDAHVKEAYLKNTVMDGKSAQSGEVTLKAGEYIFFCPMNPTPEYRVIVK